MGVLDGVEIDRRAGRGSFSANLGHAEFYVAAPSHQVPATPHRRRRSRPALVEDVPDGHAVCAGVDGEHVEPALELVDVDVAAAQVSHAAVELERVSGVQYPAVVDARHVARLQPPLQPRRRPVEQVREGRVRRVVRLDVRLRHVQRSLERRRPRHSHDSTTLRLGDDVRTSVSVIGSNLNCVLQIHFDFIQCFEPLTLLFRRQEGHPACKN